MTKSVFSFIRVLFSVRSKGRRGGRPHTPGLAILGFLLFACGLSGCSSLQPSKPTPQIIYVTPTPRIVQVTATPEPSPTPTITPVPPTPIPTPEPLVALAELEGSLGPIYSLAWSPGGNVIASAGYGQVKLWDAETKEELTTLEGHTDYVWGVAWSPASPEGDTGGNILASASQDGTVRLWDVQTAEELVALDTGWAFCVAWSPDGSQLAVGTQAGDVQIWDVETGQLSDTLEGTSLIISIGWSPDGRTIAAGQWDGIIRRWDTATGEQLEPLVGTTQARSDVNGLAWSPASPEGGTGGRRLASAHQDGKVRLWDAENGQMLQVLEGHRNWVRGVAWSPDGRQLASTGADATLRVWDTETGQQVARLKSGTLSIWSVAFSPDGSGLATGNGRYEAKSPGGTLAMWGIPLEITYIDNDSFLIVSSGKKILMDVHSSPTPPEVRRLIEQALPPFDGVDLLLITHAHSDHFDPRMVGAHLGHNPNAILVSTEEVVDVLRQYFPDFEETQERTRTFEPEEGEKVPVTLNGIDLEILYLSHGPDAGTNLGFLISLGGRKLLHTGDIYPPDVLQTYDFPGENVDIAFVPYFFLLEEEFLTEDGRSVMLEAIQARQIVPMHFPWGGNLESTLEELAAGYPESILFREAMETWTTR